MSTNKKVSVLGTVFAVAATTIIPGVALASQDVKETETVNKTTTVNQTPVVNESTNVNKTSVVTEQTTINKTPAVKRMQADSLLRTFGTVTRNGSSPECSVQKLPR